jgi:hypothetical protein
LPDSLVGVTPAGAVTQYWSRCPVSITQRASRRR